ncbi:MAG TPA: YfcE family phosphodiesterase [Pirellulales bacterium]|nr:YfcE family phosphodiesterase [Pirellulales bacterium]
MRIGVVSDTHGQMRYTQNAVRMLESLDVGLVLHCGDIGSAGVVELFAPWPTHFVFGNVDDPPSLRAAIHAAGQTCHERFGRLELAGRRVAFLHGDDARLLEETIADGTWDLVCHGHTHVARLLRRGGTLVLNPGAVYRANPHSVAVVELSQLEATVVEVW